MAKNRFSMLPKLQTPSMSPSYAYTVGSYANPLLADDEDSDICPVCDGECTCDNKPRDISFPPANGSSLNIHNSIPTSSSSHSSAPVTTARPTLPSLKIKLTVPQSMLGKRRVSPSNNKKIKNVPETTSAGGNDGDTKSSPFSAPGKPLVPQASSSYVLQDPPAPKRRGRPPKAVVAARALAAAKPAAGAHAAATLSSPYQAHGPRPLKRKNTLPSKQKARPSAAWLPPKLKKGPSVKKSAPATTKRQQVVSSDLSDLSDVDDRYGFREGDDEDARSVQFPTFVSASALSSASSDESDTTSLTGFDTDSSMEAEEENFIVAEETRSHDRARIRRELLGGDEGGQKKRDPQNNWVIRPRKKSVGLSDVEMDVDSDATEDDDEDEDEDGDGDDDDEETDGRGASAGYVGLATGWSEDDESSFDADLFFANLSDSDDRDGSSSPSDDEEGDDGDQSDISCSDVAASGFLPSVRPDLDSLPLEVMEAWDGQLVFTNGLTDGQDILDIDFEVHTAQFIAEASPSPSQESDVEMTAVSDPEEDGGYEEDADGGEGETTDEELVGDDDLPNERAMRLFSLPFSVSAINPMSTMSPTVSPAPHSRMPFGSQSHLGSPKPADILAGKVFWDSDEPEDFDDSNSKSRSLSSSRGGMPRAGTFEPAQQARQAIIDGTTKDIPSPHPRFRRGRGKSVSHLGRYDTVKGLSRRHLLSSRASSVAASPRSPFPLSSEDVMPTSPELPSADAIDLDDVLEASFLDPDPSDPPISSGASATSEDDSRRHLKNLSRWDLISVGAFRQTREGDATGPAAGWGSDTAPVPSADYGSMMKSSPLSTMLWHNKGPNNTSRHTRGSVGSAISPVILPVGDRDGDRTPTNTPPHHVPPSQKDYGYPQKTRKELRRERKLKRKSHGPAHHHQQHHHHQHYPNSKSRSTSSAQRSFFNSSSVPPLNI